MLKKNTNLTNLGITLISLVITIIILLIIVGISITTLTGDNGLIINTGNAKIGTVILHEKEELETEIINLVDKKGDLDISKVTEKISSNIKDIDNITTTDETFPIIITYKNGNKYYITDRGDVSFLIDSGDTSPVNINSLYVSGNYTAAIPAEFTVSNENDEKSIENGLVVKDKNDNEWVWIPVNKQDLEKMFVKNTTGWNMLGTSGTTAVNTKLRSRELTSDNSFKLGNIQIFRTTPGTVSDNPREPDVLSNYDIESNYLEQAGFNSLVDMATNLKNDYKNMIYSIKENGGFYVGRYELGIDSNNNPQEKAGSVMNELNWYQLYKNCKEFSDENVDSRMIWGCQIDQICRFINTYGTNKVSNLDDMTSYGNYSGTFDGNTGNRSYCKTNNIYDLAGNCYETTQEAYHDSYRISRGRILWRW